MPVEILMSSGWIETVGSEATDLGGSFSIVNTNAAPDEATDVEDGRDLALVILGPSTPHTGRGAGPSPATDLATNVFQRCRRSQRIRRNLLFFVAADEVELGKTRENM